MPTDLYETLGVGKDASQEQIQKAYRKRSKTAHPDGGGSEAEFAQVAKAKNVLLNPHHRAEYDRTGRTEFNPSDTDHQLMSIITQTLAAVIAGPVDVDRMSPLQIMNQHFIQERTKMRQSQDNLNRMKTRMETVIRRATPKKGKGEEPKILLVEVAKATIRAYEADLASLEEKLSLMERAIEVVTGHDYQVEISSGMFFTNSSGTAF